MRNRLQDNLKSTKFCKEISLMTAAYMRAKRVAVDFLETICCVTSFFSQIALGFFVPNFLLADFLA